MNNNLQIGNLGEIKLIKLIEELILKKTGKELLRDDSFFFEFKNEKSNRNIVINSDMLVYTTDVPPLMSSYQIGRKSVVMNVSDLLVKGVRPRGLIISFGLPKELKLQYFMDLVNGIIDCSMIYDMDYIGGDLNETKELIINPMVFGFKNPSAIVHRKGIKVGDILIANNKFGLTGVGFDILLNKRGDLKDFPNYKKSIMSILEPQIAGIEAIILSERRVATSSIDSSDGLSKSLQDLMFSNPNVGFEIDFNANLIEKEAFQYSNEFNVSLEDLVFNGGEEFIHLFTIDPKDFTIAQNEIQSKNGQIFRIGKVISEENIFIVKEGERKEIKSYGFEHFSKKG
ncbi:MAG: thiamine-monophosphate kinase [Candidatus Lokiarchaeota archaeon]|nr:thiamine-monophosphate kinase [Candidatus Lokiarchaeota archaeon]